MTEHHASSSSVPRSWVLFAVVATVFVLLCAWAWFFTMDDAYIAWRYSKNIGDGLGPVWNPDPSSEFRAVEGYSSFLTVWLVGLVYFVTGVAPFWLGKGLGVISGLILIGCVVRETRRRRIGWHGSLVALSFFALPFTIVNSVSGMETGFFFLWNWLCAMGAVWLAEKPSRAGVWSFVLFGFLATLTRPDFAIIFASLVAYVFWRARPVRRTLVLAVLALYAVPGLILTGWRYEFYGDLVPNTFYVKQKAGLQGFAVRYVFRFVLFLVVPYLIASVRRWRTLWASNRDLLIVTGLCLVIPCAYFTTTVPLMGWWYRFLLPQLSLVALVAGVGVGTNGQAVGKLLRWAPTLGVSLVVAGSLAHLPPMIEHLYYREADEARYVELAERLRPFRSSDRWLNFYDVGTVPYASEWNTVDVVGLNTHREDLASDCSLKTDLILRSWSSIPAEPRKDIPNPCQRDLELYTAIADLPWVDQGAAHYRYMRVFARSDIAYADALSHALLDDWPAPYQPPSGFAYRYTERFKSWVGR